jgi:hypothetical protein
MKEPVDHILRPRLPWRPEEGGITECGYDASKVKTLTREEFFQRFKDYGQKRTALLTCMTCSDTARRWRTWEEDPRQALSREIEWERGGFYLRARNDRGERLKDELIAIVELIEAHGDEFNALVDNRQKRREWLEKKSEMACRPKPAPQRGL